MIVIALIVGGIGLFSLFIWNLKNSGSNKALQNRVSVAESTAEASQKLVLELRNEIRQKYTAEQLAWEEKLKKEYEEIFEGIKKEISKDSKANKEELIKKLAKEKESFDKIAKDAYDKACENIKFDEVNYKKTITLKRKNFAAKNKKNAKPKRTWRFIDEE